MRKKIILALTALVLAVLPLSAATVHTFNAAYTYHENSHIGIDYTAYPTGTIGLYGGLNAQFTIDGMSPAILVGGTFGPAFNFMLDGYKENVMLQLAIALDAPVSVNTNTNSIAIGLGALADIGIRWRIIEGVQNDGLYLSLGAKAAYYFTWFDLSSMMGTSTGGQPSSIPWRVTPYFGIGFCY